MINSLYEIYLSLTDGFLSKVFYWITSPVAKLVSDNVPSDGFWGNILNGLTTILASSFFANTSILDLILGGALALLVSLIIVRFLLSFIH